ncbi:hypothetical protein PRIPAC_75813 [Pristionchus pacificus]|uniref:Uncharacterized protein n=1 Tax=Pristionchus pacificus TaxID=54126 RepID=A0A2A6C0Q0_PRIPA|nr:hypothetical protein PRIPAC_75813 [Pristionchus pacificus]|eukprot:PDM71698.1 hypothetical protein PRIPAC_38105 [Pristionchus pacificus]
MIPCVIALVRTATMHGNCKAFLVLSSLCSILLLISQIAVFIFDIVIDNLAPMSDVKERWFLVFHNVFYFTTSCLSLVIALERCHAIRNPAAYEQQSVNYFLVLTALFLATLYAVCTVYLIYWHGIYFETIYMMYAIEATVILISAGLYFYSKQRLRDLPYTSDRVNAKYQVVEILEFSRAIVPALVLSAGLKSASLIPTMLWQAGIISYVLCCLFYFTIHALNCILMKATLFYYHRALWKNLQRLLFCASGRISPEPAPAASKEDETKLYFSMIQSSWNQ